MSLESRRNAKEAYMAELQYKRQITKNDDNISSNNNNNNVSNNTNSYCY